MVILIKGLASLAAILGVWLGYESTDDKNYESENEQFTVYSVNGL